MRSTKRWVGIGAALGLILALVPVVQGRNVAGIDLTDPLGKLAPRQEPEPVNLKGLDLTRLTLKPRRVTASLGEGKNVELTLDPELQRAAQSLMERQLIPEAGVVMMDVKTGEVLVYASHVSQGTAFDVNARAEAPAASIFKVVTGAALVEGANLTGDTEQCYRGGKSRIEPDELHDDPARDKWCTSLAMAMGSSTNVVFARLAQKHLTPEDLTAMGGAFGFGASVPFAIENEPPKIDIPADPVEFARSAAGFWHTSLSPLAAVSMVQAIANAGVALRPRIVRKVTRDAEVLWEQAEEPAVLRRAIKPTTARELTKMMSQTVASGSAFRAFHDPKARPFLPGMQIAGKTGTLTRYQQNRHYTWFVGFAPADSPKVAVSALVVNTPNWRIKAPVLARDVLRAYFAKEGWRGVTRP